MREDAAINIGGKLQVTWKELEELTHARRIVESSVHPDTNKLIPLVMRMSGFVILNVPILAIMLFSRLTPFQNAIMQMLNQTYNAGMNYGNRNASSPYTVGDLTKGFVGALSSSVIIALAGRYAFAN
mmetsp:Transcript_44935/g.43511  ORF Transcript_44935/g.43511 Transcript_44935/m.43511 type:complete len:127 (-) Transcript_44935:483-863(-)|eukprot:CAMPEP_0170561802 /NCGR_PEP_ID=MMETSP0211-20121228/57129_1 /TAXON_ID=311385 /ORGANISM="Pseudokeronopsis sp., Strain OXSARD2" /LENGTH=126 /DNA_ID=CAMNT_0010877833 /DNA_START=218 /DNA_END=598 /DNA_ORIENTATION=-